MHKNELIEALRRYASEYDIRVLARHNWVGWKGQKPFALFLAEYLNRLNIPDDENYDFWRIEDYLPALLVAAFETLRTSNEDWVASCRQMYVRETEHAVPNITDLGEGDMLNRSSAVQTTLCFLLKDVTGNNRIENSINRYCNAQEYVLQQVMDKFLRRVWWRGMHEITDKCLASGMSGKFGRTELRTYIAGGRIMFTFARRKRGKTTFHGPAKEVLGELPYREDTVSFVADDSDPLALGTGLQSIHTDFRTALDMIEEVVRGWPNTEEERAKIYRIDTEVSII